VVKQVDAIASLTDKQKIRFGHSLSIMSSDKTDSLHRIFNRIMKLNPKDYYFFANLRISGEHFRVPTYVIRQLQLAM